MGHTQHIYKSRTTTGWEEYTIAREKAKEKAEKKKGIGKDVVNRTNEDFKGGRLRGRDEAGVGTSRDRRDTGANKQERQTGMATLTLLGLQSRFGDKLLRIRLVCPQNGTAVLKASRTQNGKIVSSSKGRREVLQ